MRLAIKIALAGSCLLVLSTCRLEGLPTVIATKAATAPTTVSAMPSAASSISAQAPRCHGERCNSMFLLGHLMQETTGRRWRSA
jgi:hypothetical protein